MSGWWCEAYGPPAPGVDPGRWPQCFVWAASDPTRQCSSPEVCAHTMAAERRRVFQRIQEGAAAGDETMAFLAQEFTSPDQMLGPAGGDGP